MHETSRHIAVCSANVSTYFIETLGCQMNKLDSALVSDALTEAGLSGVAKPEHADLAVLNTCSVREHAETKALSRLGHWNHLRTTQGRPAVIAVVGCFAQRAPQAILAEAKFIDIVCGPGRLHELPTLAGRVQRGRPVVAVDDLKALRTGQARTTADLEAFDTCRAVQTRRFQAYVRVQRGCDTFCTYCIVPHVRGPECSRPMSNILDEVMRLDAAGVKEITLLGQTVSSYRHMTNGRAVGLADLLRSVHERTSIPRIRFVTSYPGGFPINILHATAELERVCPYLHLPAQHGADRILKRMNRKYTVEHYLDLIAQGRRIVPGLSLAGDFIVGFPGETDEDHHASLNLLQAARYKNCFVFKYSPRPGTTAARRYRDDVSDEAKTARVRQMLAAQDAVASADNQRLLGRTVSVLVEGPSKKAKSDPHTRQLTGRTVDDKIVVFDGPPDLTGRIIDVMIERATALTLMGTSHAANT